jgi:hypothetical protein
MMCGVGLLRWLRAEGLEAVAARLPLEGLLASVQGGRSRYGARSLEGKRVKGAC